MLSKKHIDPCSCHLTVDITVKFINGRYSEATKCTLLFLPLSSPRGSKQWQQVSRSPRTVNCQYSGCCYAMEMPIDQISTNTLFKKRHQIFGYMGLRLRFCSDPGFFVENLQGGSLHLWSQFSSLFKGSLGSLAFTGLR